MELILSRLTVDDCKALVSMFSSSLQLLNKHEAKDVIKELIAILMARSSWEPELMSSQQFQKNLSGLIEKDSILKLVPVVRFNSIITLWDN